MSITSLSKKLTMDHPFSLVTLIQPPDKPPRNAPNMAMVPIRTTINRIHTSQVGKEDREKDAGEIYQIPSSYQTQAADLSLHHSDNSVEPFLTPSGTLGDVTQACNSSLYYTRVPPLAHHIVGGPIFDNFYTGSEPGTQSEELQVSGPSIYTNQEHFNHESYNDFYLARPSSYNIDPNEHQRLYSYPSSQITRSQYEPQQYPAHPPPLHPSPAVLLHIKYVMESVCQSMCFTDVTIITSTDELRAHRSILAAHSSFLSYLFVDTTTEPILLFPNFASVYMRLLLQFFYTGEVATMTHADIEPLRQICYSLGITSLMTRLDEVKLSISFQTIPSCYESQLSTSDQVEPLEQQHTSSCKFQEGTSKEKQKNKEGGHLLPVRQYTVVSKMPRDTNLQTNIKCTKCDLKFFKKDLLDEHLKVHDGKKPKECNVCNKTFNTNYHLNTHMRTHTGVKPYSCSISNCGKEFSDSSSFRRHQFTHQTPDKLFKCSVCSKSFSDRSSWRRHQAEHGQKKRFNCCLCDKKFTRRSHLKKHKYRVHQKDGEENKTDKEVDKNIKSKCHECTQCGAAFKTGGKLAQHELVHTGEKPYKCDQCNKAFARKTNLQLHMRTHTGEKTPCMCKMWPLFL